jgi:hypothetical protein
VALHAPPFSCLVAFLFVAAVWFSILPAILWESVLVTDATIFGTNEGLLGHKLSTVALAMHVVRLMLFHGPASRILKRYPMFSVLCMGGKSYAVHR